MGPRANQLDLPFWTAASSSVLVAQQCQACAAFRLPPRPRCGECGSDRYEWQQLSGRGTVLADTVVHVALHPAFAADVPYRVGLVELQEGPRMVSLLPMDGAAVDSPVSAVVEDPGNGTTVWRFVPVSASTDQQAGVADGPWS